MDILYSGSWLWTVTVMISRVVVIGAVVHARVVNNSNCGENDFAPVMIL